MDRVVVLGERSRVAGFVLAGAHVVVADEPGAVLAAWAALTPDVAVVVLTPTSAAALGPLLDESPRPGVPLPVVMPGGPAAPGGRR